MNYITYILKFILRIKWWLILCPTIVALLVYTRMGLMSRTYKSSTTIYTGVVSGYDVDLEGGGNRQDWNIINNAMDNLVNIIKAQTTLHNVSLKLFTQHMVYGDPENDNQYITAANYRDVWSRTPKDVRALIDRTSEKRTLENLLQYEVADHDNYVYGLFHWNHRFYSYEALSKIQVKRINSSDMLDVSYENTDPGVVYNTLILLNKEFVGQYHDLRFGEINNVIQFYEDELKREGLDLRNLEDSLRDYNVENQVINYDEQTKHIAALSRDFELNYEQLQQNLNGAQKLRNAIEMRLGDVLTLVKSNASFLQQINKIGDLQSQITTSEAFQIDDPAVVRQTNVPALKQQLAAESKLLENITAQVSSQQYTKEGISSNSMVQQWLEAVMLEEKSKAELDVMTNWKKRLDERYLHFSPVGSTLKRKNREIDFSERSYLSILQALNTARLRQKNLQMSSATLKVINPPVLPLGAEPSKRKLVVFAAFFCTFFFLLGLFILLELLDRTLRDKIRTERITGGRVLGAFPGSGRLGQRSYVKTYQNIASHFMGNAVLNYFKPTRPNIVNFISTQQDDGKSLLMEHLAAQLRESGMKVRTVSWNKDFNIEQKEYLLAHKIGDFVQDIAGEVPLGEADVILMEYPAFSKCFVPKELLQEACVNLFVASATRTWKDDDQLLYDKAVELTGMVPLVIYLNKTSREVVEGFTGLMPPYTRFRRIKEQWSQLGFMATK
ncbi:MAG: exopolysaccharide biosynthesis protein [Alistipes sp.]